MTVSRTVTGLGVAKELCTKDVKKGVTEEMTVTVAVEGKGGWEVGGPRKGAADGCKKKLLDVGNNAVVEGRKELKFAPAEE